jgi:hypothetical protein
MRTSMMDKYSFNDPAWGDGPAFLADRTELGRCRSAGRALVLADVENLTHCAAGLGYRMGFRGLAKVILSAWPNSELHAFLSCSWGEDDWNEHLDNAGWLGHTRPTVQRWQEPASFRGANSDVQIAFHAGRLLSAGSWDFAVVCTGDGDLGLELSRLAFEVTGNPAHVLAMINNRSANLSPSRASFIQSVTPIGLDSLIPDGTLWWPEQRKTAHPLAAPGAWRCR